MRDPGQYGLAWGICGHSSRLLGYSVRALWAWNSFVHTNPTLAHMDDAEPHDRERPEKPVPPSESFASEPRGMTAIEPLRWLAVLPVAIGAGWVGGMISGLAYLLFSLGGAIDLRGAGYSDALLSLLVYVPNGVGFSLGGAMMAPRLRLTTAGTLAVCWIAGSLQTVRKFTEHLGRFEDTILGMTRTVIYRGAIGAAASKSQLHVEHHGTHHRWAAIPYYNLPQATEIVYVSD